MKITLIQTSLHWEDAEKNIIHFDALLNTVTTKTDLIVLPEMFSTGFTMNPEKLAEESPGAALRWLIAKAKEKQCVITGSISVKDNGKFYNRLYWVSGDGNIQKYDKRHLFRMAKEDQHFSAGTKKIITKINEWRLCPLVCYDLRFPVWSRNQFDVNKKEWTYDVLIYVANWPEARSYAWKQLLIARAIENQCYVVAVNRIGKDGNGFEHSGDSVVINPRGEVVSSIKNNEESVTSLSLDKNYLEEFRKIFPVGMDADNFEVL